MKIKRIRVFGFKTFADRTEFDIDADLIAIVGPNGCGKSNIVDAILWGLGEPNARHLRAATSQDVIFNGSAKRKPLGYAEVTLIFDNEDGSLPIASAEVAVSRRLTRAGESHYAINKRACRLKDIFDLLADSGLGRSGYAIVSQREIDQALSASAEDRRAWLDEAAGVQRFRAKRGDALRRLAESDQHLERLHRLQADLATQREPLEEEAKLAEEYLRLREALQQIETGLLALDLKHCDTALEACVTRIEQGTQAIARENEASERIRVESRILGENIADLERKQDALRELRQSMLSQGERAFGALQLSQQRLASLDELEGNLLTELERLAITEKEAAQDAEIAAKERSEDQRLLDEVLNTRELATSSLAKVQRELQEIDRLLSSAQQAAAERIRLTEQKRAAEHRLTELDQEREGIVVDLPELTKGLEETGAQYGLQEKAATEALQQVHAAQERIQALDHEVAKLETERRALLSKHAALDGRRRGIEATLDSLEGLGQGALAVMSLVRHGDLPAHYTPVGQAIEAPRHLAVAIETALGGAAHDLIVPSDADAKVAIEHLKARRLGRATFQPLNLVRQNRPAELNGLLSRPGVIGVASEQVECEVGFRPVIDSLLGRILIAETLDAALALARTSGWSRIVTLDGEVVHSAGAVSGGKSQRQGTGLVQRKAELRAVEEELAALSQSVTQKDTQRSALAEQEATLRAELPDLQAKHRALQSEAQDAESWLRKLRDELQSTEREAQRIERESEKLRAVRQAEVPAEMDAAELQNRRDALVAELAKQDHAAQHSIQRVAELRARLERANLRLREAEKRRDDVRNGHHRRDQRQATIAQDREALAQAITEQKATQAKAEQEAKKFAEELEVVASKRQGMLERSLNLAEQLQKSDGTTRALQEGLRSAEIERARTESKRAAAAQRLLEEYGMEVEAALSLADVAEIPDDAQHVVGKIRRELKGLGHPNLGAIEAYQKLTERWTELTFQLEDLEASRKEIDTSISELDALTRDRFLDAFTQVNAQFGVRFNQLFGGGEASLSLTDNLNPLTSGVEIDLTIPGKKKQRLELLSGGERSLCGCAFLFALLSVKPSPLVVLDEVDAPLDGRNVERYIDVLKSFQGVTQFLVITHNPVTIEAAPVWFGVTMREPGVTTILPYTAPSQQGELVEAVVHNAFLQPIQNN